MRQIFTLHRRFIALVIVYIAAVLLQMILLPPFEGGDEMLHFNYTGWILEHNTLPDRNTADENSTRQASGQAPLYYLTAALVARVLNLPHVDGDALYAELETIGTFKNGWYAPPDEWNETDNRNLYLASLEPEMAEETPYAEATPTLRVLRFVSLGFGLLGVIGAYGAAHEVFRSSLWRLTAATLFALTPQYVHMSAIFHNDIAPYALAAVAIWLSLRMLRTGASYRLLILTGIVVGLAGLAKINALLIVPGVILAISYATYKRGQLPTALLKVAVFGAFTAVIFLPWALWGEATYGDPLGTDTHLRSGYYYRWPLLLTETMPLIPEAYLGYWGKLASAVYLQPIMYTFLGSILAFSALGYWLGRHLDWRYGKLREQQFAVCALILLVSALGAFQWLRTIHFVTGRLLYPAHLPIMLAVAGGLALLARRTGYRRVVAGYTGGVMVAAAFIGAPLSLIAAYTPPANQPVDMTTLEGPQYDFADTIRFLGFRRDDDLIHEPLTRMTLCWEVLGETERPAAFAIKFQNGADEVADRTSVFGMGRYPSGLWTPGTQFCDQVDIPLTGEPVPGQAYNVILVVLDAATGAVDWPATALDGTPVEYPFLGTAMLP